MPTATLKCPPAERLARYVLGQLPAADSELVREHMAECDVCAGKFGDQNKMESDPVGLTAATGVVALHRTSFETPPVTQVATPLPARSPGLRQGPLPADVHGDPIKVFSSPDFSSIDEYRFLRPAIQPGDLGQLGPYRILKELGRGGMGVVFQAIDTTLTRNVALKVMHPESAGDAKARARFVREAKAVGALDHPNVVTVYQVGEDNKVPYLAMQFLKGESLDNRLDRDHQLPVRDVLRIGREVCQGLHAAHTAGVVHRDIKPANVWLEADGGRVKILDFGLARSADDQALTRTGAVVGTPAFMSPEQATGRPLDCRSDLFSLGSMLYTILTGKIPFDAENDIAVLAAIVKERPRAITELNPSCPELLVRAVWRLMSKHPDDRPRDAAEAAELFTLLEAEFDPATQSGRELEQQELERKSPRGLWIQALALGVLASGLGYVTINHWSDIQRMVHKASGQK